MSYSGNPTTNVGLPQWIASDKPTWLGDMNGAFRDIDTAIGTAINTADSAETLANSANQTAQTASTTANNAQSTANSANQTAQSASTTANNALSTANSANQTAQSAVSSVNTLISDLGGLKIVSGNVTTDAGGNAVIDSATFGAYTLLFSAATNTADTKLSIFTNAYGINFVNILHSDGTPYQGVFTIYAMLI